jgi:hypothetical protein
LKCTARESQKNFGSLALCSLLPLCLKTIAMPSSGQWQQWGIWVLFVIAFIIIIVVMLISVTVSI